jgi:glycosyltransferase involved in cell wall biosynthesis
MVTVMPASRPAPRSVAPRPKKILHVIGAFNRGGVEAWLLNLVRTIDCERFHIDFIVHSDSPGAYNRQIRECGSTIATCASPSNPWQYRRRFFEIVSALGPYDAVHSHVHHFSGYVLRLASQAGIPGRIVHSHSDTSMLDSQAAFPRLLYLSFMRQQIRRYATVGIAASQQAAAALYGTNWAQDPRWRILYCGIDLKPFRLPITPKRIREDLGIPKDSWVIGHVGSFTRPKNHPFVIGLGLEILKRERDAYLLLVGDGPLRRDAEQQAASSPFRNRIRFLGSRDDVPQLLRGAMDAFILPSLWEGLPLSLLEAQAAGLPCVISDVVTGEADILSGSVHRLSLNASIDEWVDAIAETRKHSIDGERAKALVQVSPFNSETSTRHLESLYASL